MTRWKVLLTLFLMLAILPAQRINAQDDGDNTCAAIVEAALEAVGDACGSIGHNEACYGHAQVDATFWEARDDLVFSNPADLVSVADVHTLTSSALDLDSGLWGLAVLKLQANVLGALPGQAITFLLMGDVSLENEVSPEKVVEAPEVTPVAATTTARSNLRSEPSTESAIVTTVDAGTALSLVGVNAARDWYQLQLEDGGAAWIWGQLVSVEDAEGLAALPVTDGTAAVTPSYGPMQAFYFSGGFGEPTCEEAPNALVVQSPRGIEITFNINGLEVRLSSTVIFTMAKPGESRVLVITLVEGNLTACFGTNVVQLTTPGASIAITLNAGGRVDPTSELVRLEGRTADVVEVSAQNTCEHVSTTGSSGSLDLPQADLDCNTPVVYKTCDVPVEISRPSINVFACQFAGGRTVAAGCSYLIRMSIGFEGASGEAEARSDQPVISLSVTMNGLPLSAESGTVVEYNGGAGFWEINQYYSTGILTPGTHIIYGTSYRQGGYVDSAMCILTAR